MEFARKREWKENGRFWQSVKFVKKDKVESARKGNCKEWNL